MEGVRYVREVAVVVCHRVGSGLLLVATDQTASKWNMYTLDI